MSNRIGMYQTSATNDRGDKWQVTLESRVVAIAETEAEATRIATGLEAERVAEYREDRARRHAAYLAKLADFKARLWESPKTTEPGMEAYNASTSGMHLVTRLGAEVWPRHGSAVFRVYALLPIEVESVPATWEQCTPETAKDVLTSLICDGDTDDEFSASDAFLPAYGAAIR